MSEYGTTTIKVVTFWLQGCTEYSTHNISSTVWFKVVAGLLNCVWGGMWGHKRVMKEDIKRREEVLGKKKKVYKARDKNTKEIIKK